MIKFYEFAGVLQIMIFFLIGIFLSVLAQDYYKDIIKSAYAEGRVEAIMTLPIDALGKIKVQREPNV